MFTDVERQEIELYFAYLYPWDDEGSNLYKSITWTFRGKDGEIAFANYAAQDMTSLMRLTETRARRPDANMYACFGTQRLARMHKTTNDGYPQAERTITNMVSYKSIALDIDAGRKGYATTADAFAALDGFIAATGLPPPTMEVYSGSGGIHIYWCFKEAVPHANWLPLAKALRDAALSYALKFDPQCTVNAAGILRIPNTLNWKEPPPKKVRLYREARHSFTQYDFQQLVGALAQYMVQPSRQSTHTASTASMKSSINQNFAAGVDEAAPPVPIDAIAVNCPAIDDILERGGNGDAEPLWNLALYAASFTTDPHDAAHRMSDQDPRYTKEGTEKKLFEKLNARAANSAAGWPTCESFSKLHTACNTCPLFPYGKSPFHHAERPKPMPNPAVNLQQDATSTAPAQGTDPLMPYGYWRNKENIVWTSIKRKDGTEYLQKVLKYPIIDGGYVPEDGSVNYQATIAGKDEWRNFNITSNMQLPRSGPVAGQGRRHYSRGKDT